MGDHADIDHSGLTGVGTGDATAHIADATDAHDASAISVLDAGTNFTGTDVEAVLAELAGMAGGLADQGDFTYLDATEAAAPSTPASGFVRIYAKSDGRIYSKDDTGTEYGPFDAAGGGAGGPLLLVDDIALHGDGDDFGSGMGGWTAVGTGSASATVTTEPYDATCIDLTFAAQFDRWYKAIDAGDWTYYLTVYGWTNGAASAQGGSEGMLALAAVDNSGAGTGMSAYNDGNVYLWGMTGHGYQSTGNIVRTGFTTAAPYATNGMALVYRLSKSGTTIEGAVSFNGGGIWHTNTRTDSTTFTRIMIGRIHNGGGTNPTMRVGRFNLVP